MSLKNIKGLLVDIDGTLMKGDALLPGAASFLRFLDEKGISFFIVSNNTKSPETYHQRFAQKGIDIQSDRIFTSVNSTELYLLHHPNIRTVYVIGKPDLHKAVQKAGTTILPDAKGDADAVVVGGDFTLDFEKLKNAVLHLQRCRRLIGSNGDMLIPTSEGLVPEAGMTLAALSAATGVQPVVLGKPEAFFFDLVLERLDFPKEQVAMLGDRLDTDILGANNAGLSSILVCTGVDTFNSIERKNIKPDVVANNLMDLMRQWP